MRLPYSLRPVEFCKEFALNLRGDLLSYNALVNEECLEFTPPVQDAFLSTFVFKSPVSIALPLWRHEDERPLTAIRRAMARRILQLHQAGTISDILVGFAYHPTDGGVTRSDMADLLGSLVEGTDATYIQEPCGSMCVIT
ncbi:hypothetical protein AHF37_12586 [Paragonimus kellicotti]|nr:hypothetical protein AHF37_12586 [Paragonimus kellicotti]